MQRERVPECLLYSHASVGEMVVLSRVETKMEFFRINVYLRIKGKQKH